MGAADKWNKKYFNSPALETPPAKVLSENQHLLPEHGLALDLACGRAGNALLMAQHGLETHAWDISEVIIAQLKEKEIALNLSINPQQRDLLQSPPEPDSFDVIVISRFLDRKIVPALINALRPGGLIFYQTFIRDKVNPTGPKNPDYLLAANELLNLFSPLHIIVYREGGSLGNTHEGFRNEAMLIAQRR